MSDLNLRLSDGGADDLPRTLRREREARERAAQAASTAAYQPDSAWSADHAPQPAVVTDIKVPFHKLMLFFIKAVFAAVPALIILTIMLYLGGQALKHYFPEWRHFEILIKATGTSPVSLNETPKPVPARK